MTLTDALVLHMDQTQKPGGGLSLGLATVCGLRADVPLRIVDSLLTTLDRFDADFSMLMVVDGRCCH